MDEKKFVQFKHDELGVREYIKRSLGKGRVSEVSIEYTPVGEKIIVATDKPGIVIGSRGEKINELTATLKKRFKLITLILTLKRLLNPDWMLILLQMILHYSLSARDRYASR